MHRTTIISRSTSTFPGSTRSRARHRSRAGLAGALLAVIVLGACSTDSSDASLADTEVAADASDEAQFAAETAPAGLAAPETIAPAASEEAAPTTIADRSGVAAAAGELATQLPIGRNQIKTATIQMLIPTDRFVPAVDAATVQAGAVGGFVSSSNITGGEPTGSFGPNGEQLRNPRTGEISMRVPSAAFDETRTKLKSLGTVVAEQLSGQEVSRQLVDNEARLTSLRLQEEAYRKLFEKASTVADIVAVQQQVTDVRTQIEQLNAQTAALRDQVSLSTITVVINEELAKLVVTVPEVPEKVDPSFGDRVRETWSNAIDALGAILAAVAIAAVAVAPFLPFVLVAIMIGRITLRRSRSRQQHRPAPTFGVQHPTAPDTAPTPDVREPQMAGVGSETGQP
jgi:hypothetical protein